MSLRSLLLLTIAAVIVAELIAAVLVYLPFDASAGQLIGDILRFFRISRDEAHI